MKFHKDEDYIVYYSNQLKNDSKLFSQHKKFLESQMEASRSLFSNIKRDSFKKFARVYLKGRGIIC